MLKQRFAQLRWLLESHGDEHRALHYCKELICAFKTARTLDLQGISFSELLDAVINWDDNLSKEIKALSKKKH